MAANFTTVLNPPKSESAILQQFWANAPPQISYLSIDQLSLINQMILTMVRGDAMLWNSLADMGSNLTNIFSASGQWLDVIALGFYGLTRTTSSAAVGSLLVGAGSSGSPPSGGTTITFTNAKTGLQYTGVYGGGTTNTVRVIASQSGPIGNCSILDLTSSSPTSYAISSNDPTLQNLSNNTSLSVSHDPTQWLLFFGSNQEGDDKLRQRCLDLLSMRASGGFTPLYAQLRSVTNGQCARIYVPRGYTVTSVYVAGTSGPLSPYWETLVSRTANQYSQASASTTIVGCATPITINQFALRGYLYMPPGVSQDVISAIYNGLSDYINSFPIVGFEPVNMRLIDLERRVLQLDSTDSCVPSMSVVTQGVMFSRANDIVVPSAGSAPYILQADLSNLVVSYR